MTEIQLNYPFLLGMLAGAFCLGIGIVGPLLIFKAINRRADNDLEAYK